MIQKSSKPRAPQVSKLVPIHFEFNSPEAVTVQLAGSFNEWSPRTSPMERNSGGRWATVAKLRPGAYEYCLVVDGRWILDPLNQLSVHNPYGGRNSVLTVTASNDTAHLINAELQPFLIARKNGPVGNIRRDKPKVDPYVAAGSFATSENERNPASQLPNI